MARWFRDRSHQLGIPNVSLRRLLPEARFVGCQDLEVTGCSSDSHRLEPGQLFVMLEHDPRDLTHALEHGAAGVLLERDCPGAGPLQIVVPDCRRAQARLCHALAGEPSQRLELIAIAGTRGRTQAAIYLRSILETGGQHFGHVDDQGWSDGPIPYPRPDSGLSVENLAWMLASMAERRRSGAIVELSPTALASRLDEGLEPLRAVIATALPRPVLINTDPFATRRNHARLPWRLEPGRHLVLHGDDPEAGFLGAVRLDIEPITYSFNRHSNVQIRTEPDGPGGQYLRLSGLGGELTARLQILGTAAALGAAAAASLARLRGIPDQDIIPGLESLDQIPGHLEAVRGRQSFGIWVDAARTPEDLDDSLRAVRQAVRGTLRLVLTLSDISRANEEMVAVGAALADQVILTSDTSTNGIDLETYTSAPRESRRLGVDHDQVRAIETTLAATADEDAVLIISGRRPRIEQSGRRFCVQDERAIAADWIANSRRHRYNSLRRA